ncbi:MAG: type II 3-dehydroquinate dehydratase [bacterium]
MKKILVIHGPNLNLLGKREVEVYGKVDLNEINKRIRVLARKLKQEVDIKQTSHEGSIVELIGKSEKKYRGIIVNPAAYTHTSVAIRDAVSAVSVPVIEVHLSNIYRRDEFRHRSLIAAVCQGQISGFGPASYLLALHALADLI